MKIHLLLILFISSSFQVIDSTKQVSVPTEDQIENKQTNIIPKEGITESELLSLVNTVLAYSGGLIAVVSLLFGGTLILGVKEILKMKDLNRSLVDLNLEMKNGLNKYKTDVIEITNKLDDYRDELEKKIKKSIESSYLLNEAESAFHRADYVRSIEYYKGILEISPENLNLYYQIGRCYLYLGNSNLARIFFEKSIEKDSNYSLAYHGLSRLNRFENLDRAIFFSKKACDLNPDNHNYHEFLGLLYRDNNDLEKAINHFELSYKSKRMHDICMFLSIAYKQVGNEIKSKNFRLEANELADEDIKVGYRLIWAYMTKWFYFAYDNKVDQALEYISKLNDFLITEHRLKLIKSNVELFFEVFEINKKVQKKYLKLLNQVLGGSDAKEFLKKHVTHNWELDSDDK